MTAKHTSSRDRGSRKAAPSASRWQLVIGGHHVCHQCGQMVTTAWCWWQKPTLCTQVLCEPCVEAIVKEGDSHGHTH